MEAGEAAGAVAVAEVDMVAGWVADELAVASLVALMAGSKVVAPLVRVEGLEGTDCWEPERARERLGAEVLAEAAMAWAASVGPKVVAATSAAEGAEALSELAAETAPQRAPRCLR